MEALAGCIIRVQAVSVWEGCHAVLNVQPPCYAFQTPPTLVWLGAFWRRTVFRPEPLSAHSADVTRHTR